MSASTTAPLPRSTVPAENSVDARFGQLASEEQIRTAAAALEQNGIQVTVVKDRDEATRTALGLIPDGAKVLDAPSQTLVALGLDKTLAESTRFQPLRAEFMRLYQAQDFDGLRKLGAAPDVVIGSVHAITEKGQVVVASASGSQLGPYVSGAGKVIWIAGTQKIVPDLDAAFERVDQYTFPRENERAQKAYGKQSFAAKLLVINREFRPGRIHLILIRENLGF
jgi:hypothetical protein